MRLPHLTISALLAVFVLMSCGTSPHAEASSELTADERIQEIEDLEKVMFSYERSSPDSIRVLLMDGYEEFANDFPDHELAASYLSRSANIARTFKQFERCIQNYQRIIREYPDFEKSSR